MLEIQQPCGEELDWEMKNTYMSPAGATRQVVIMSMHVPTIRLGQRRECASRSRGRECVRFTMVGARVIKCSSLYKGIMNDCG